eukprot:scaffold17115_cov109-Isochrysis_galbana.AAC.5
MTWVPCERSEWDWAASGRSAATAFFSHVAWRPAWPPGPIIGGDFNCVENIKIDVQHPPGVNTTYPNAHSAPLRNLLASINQTDLYRLANGDQPGGYSRGGRRRRHEGLCLPRGVLSSRALPGGPENPRLLRSIGPRTLPDSM